MRAYCITGDGFRIIYGMAVQGGHLSWIAFLLLVTAHGEGVLRNLCNKGPEIRNKVYDGKRYKYITFIRQTLSSLYKSNISNSKTERQTLSLKRCIKLKRPPQVTLEMKSNLDFEI